MYELALSELALLMLIAFTVGFVLGVIINKPAGK